MIGRFAACTFNVLNTLHDGPQMPVPPGQMDTTERLAVFARGCPDMHAAGLARRRADHAHGRRQYVFGGARDSRAKRCYDDHPHDRGGAPRILDCIAVCVI